MAQLVIALLLLLLPALPYRNPIGFLSASSCSISFINTNNSNFHSIFWVLSHCGVELLVRSQWRLAKGVKIYKQLTPLRWGLCSPLIFVYKYCMSSALNPWRFACAPVACVARMRCGKRSLCASLMDSAAAPPFLPFLFAIIKLCGLPELIISLCHLISC